MVPPLGIWTDERWRIQRKSRDDPSGLRDPPCRSIPAPAGRPALSFRVVVQTDQPKARLRMTAYRGVVSATMIYDSLPINDIFRKVDDDTVLGVMDVRFTPHPFIFILRREVEPGTAEPRKR